MPAGRSKAVRSGWQIACLCLLGIFLPALVTSLGYSLTDALGPGPGFFPFWLSLIGAVLSATMLAQVTLQAFPVGLDHGGPGAGTDMAVDARVTHVLEPASPDHRAGTDEGLNLAPDRRVALQALGVLVALTVAAALFEPLGYRLTMLPFIAGLLLTLGARSPLAIALTALAGSFGVFHMFYHWLKVPLPIGEFGL